MTIPFKLTISKVIVALGFTPEPAFSKNTAFNKNFGETSNTTMQGNDNRVTTNVTFHQLFKSQNLR